ncbi:MAG: IS110 family transposase [Moraxellaceae bacterium]|nr:IS110 family transposase [Moraxellaceae bacterium]
MFYLGIDVSKASLDCCLLYQGLEGKKKNKRFTNSAKGYIELLQWLAQHGGIPAQTHIGMEATGCYHEEAAFALHEASCLVSIVNPAQVRYFAKGRAIHIKTDKVDSEIIAYFVGVNKPELWQKPTPEVLLFKGLLARLQALADDLQREKNRLEKALSTTTPTRVIASINASIRFIESEIKRLEDDKNDHISRHPHLKHNKQLLESIPAIGDKTSDALLSILHTHQFESAKKFASYLGVIPVEKQSGTLLGKTMLSKNGPSQVRAKLYMAAIVATQHNPHVKALYTRLLLKGKSKMSAIGAAMRKLAHLCFGVWKNQTPYQADFLHKSA